jgi:toxin YoeB
MNKITFAEKAWEDYLYWQETDKKTLKRINLLLRDIARNGNVGIGKPDSLKHLDGWSRRIDEIHRLVYQLKNDTIEILQ